MHQNIDTHKNYTILDDMIKMKFTLKCHVTATLRYQPNMYISEMYVYS